MLYEIIKFLKSIGIDMAILIAGLSGGLVSLRKDESLTVWEKIATVISGGVISTYLTPVFMLAFDKIIVNNSRIEYGIAFMVGYAGLKSVEMLFTKIKNKELNYERNNDTRH